MRPVISVKQGMEKLASHSGLLYIGALLDSMSLKQKLDNMKNIHCKDPNFSHAEVLFSMLSLISIGKPDYDAIEIFRAKQDFFVHALDLSGCPSAATLRQRIDLIGEAANDIVKQESAAMIRAKAPVITPIETSAGALIPLDIDVSPFDNSKTKKEGVSRTYKGYDGYAPIFAYLGAEGYLANLELREGKQHCQKDTPEFINQTLDYVRQITDQPVLMRLDSGNDSQENFPVDENIHFIIKRNLRRESLQSWLELAQKADAPITRNSHKTVWIGRTNVDINGKNLPFPIVFEVTQRYTKKGQILLFPEIEVDTYWCNNVQLSPQEVISLYHDHGTSEQFHSEIKSDMDLERLPSGIFTSNSLVLHLGLLAYNMLRIIGQISIEEQKKTQVPGIRQKKVERRRIRTVMQDLIYMAGRLTTTGRRWFISFGRLNPFAELSKQVLQRLRCCPS